MTDNESIPEAAQELAGDVYVKISESLNTLEGNLSRVEGNLNLGCENLHDLVNTENPEIREQLDVLQEGLTKLHKSLADTRTLIAHARESTVELQGVLPDQESETETESDSPDYRLDEDDLDQRVTAKMRHDEPVTLTGILRALLMADEPEQRR